MADPGGPARERAGFYLTVLGMVGAMLLQAAALFIWGAKLDQRVASLEEKAAGNGRLTESVARIDERTAGLVSSVQRIEGELSERRRR